MRYGLYSGNNLHMLQLAGWGLTDSDNIDGTPILQTVKVM